MKTLTQNYRTKNQRGIRFHRLSGKTSNTLARGKLTHIVRVPIARVAAKNRTINGDKSRQNDAADANDAMTQPIFRHHDA